MNGKVILCYIRKSWMPKNSTTVSPEQQREAVQGLVTARGFVCEWYADTDGHRSGRSEEGRPAWLSLKENLAREDVVGVAGYDLSRLYRNVKEFLAFIEELERLDKRLLLCHEMIDTGTASGRAVATILVTMHQLQADRTSERVTANIAYRRHELGQHHGPIPFGCNRVQGKLEPATGERAQDHIALQACYTHYLEDHLSYDRLAETLNQEGYTYRDRRGEPRPWGREDARRVLSNHDLYAGHLPLFRDSHDQPAELLRNAHSPIIDPQLCAKVAKEIASRAHRTTRGDGPRYLLGGLVWCATCGRKLAGYHRDGQRYYRHQGSKLGCTEVWQEADALEAASIAWLAQLNDAEFWAVAECHASGLLGMNATPEQVQRVKEAGTYIQRLSHLYLEGRIGYAEYEASYAEGLAALEAAHGLLPDMQANAAKESFQRLRGLLNNITGARFARQRTALEECFTRLDVCAFHVVEAVPQQWLTPIWELVHDRLFSPPASSALIPPNTA